VCVCVCVCVCVFVLFSVQIVPNNEIRTEMQNFITVFLNLLLLPLFRNRHYVKYTRMRAQ